MTPFGCKAIITGLFLPSNPAIALRTILREYHIIPDDQLNDASFDAWEKFCDENNLTTDDYHSIFQ